MLGQGFFNPNIQAVSGGGDGGPVTWASIIGRPSAFVSTIPLVEGLESELSDIRAAILEGGGSGAEDSCTCLPLIWSNISDKPTTFTPEAHGHSMDDITGLNNKLEDIKNSIPAPCNCNGSHPESGEGGNCSCDITIVEQLREEVNEIQEMRYENIDENVLPHTIRTGSIPWGSIGNWVFGQSSLVTPNEFNIITTNNDETVTFPNVNGNVRVVEFEHNIFDDIGLTSVEGIDSIQVTLWFNRNETGTTQARIQTSSGAVRTHSFGSPVTAMISRSFDIESDDIHSDGTIRFALTNVNNNTVIHVRSIQMRVMGTGVKTNLVNSSQFNNLVSEVTRATQVTDSLHLPNNHFTASNIPISQYPLGTSVMFVTANPATSTFPFGTMKIETTRFDNNSGVQVVHNLVSAVGAMQKRLAVNDAWQSFLDITPSVGASGAIQFIRASTREEAIALSLANEDAVVWVG